MEDTMTFNSKYALGTTGKGLAKNTKENRATASNSKKLKRYTLVLPEELFNELQDVADGENIKVVELLRKFIKLGLLAVQVQNTPDAALLIRDGNTEQQILLL